MLKRNLIANYFGQGWVALMGLIFIPVYIKILGIEAYGLIGLFGVLQAWLTFFDMGITPTLTREMARFTGGAHSPISIRDLLRSIEVIALSTATLIGLGIWLASGWLAENWLRSGDIPPRLVTQAISIMGAVAALRFVEGIYRSAIVGLQQQVLFNLANCVLSTFRALGAFGILTWVSPTIDAFFIWQGLVSVFSLAVLASITYKFIPKCQRSGKFTISILHDISNFAGGMMKITFLSLLLMQIDKLILSKLLTLTQFGYYTLAATIAGVLYMIVGPIGQAWFPKLTELLANKQQNSFIKKYHQASQLVSIFMGASGLMIITFSEEILLLWFNDIELAQRNAMLLRILALGNLLNCLMWIPYQAQLAYGWTILATRINMISVIIIVPAIFWITPVYGAEGAAWVWVSLNCFYIFIGNHFMYQKILIAEKWRWYRQDVLQPIFAASLITIISIS